MRAQRLLSEDRGSVTAEFAIVLPAVLMVLALSVGAIMISAQRIVLSGAVAEIARLEARGDHASAAVRIGQLDAGVAVQRARAGPLHCVTLTSSPGRGALSLIEVSSRSCAAVSERE